ncbi:Alpha/Beta hydrolase protein [Aspergillus cavernicola]|uniref:Alpha/Beta hydrolase protein n=1 Tax=Aspergillus cavernicola TaxID=176166 RepID=A0ABR4IW47_9EURO
MDRANQAAEAPFQSSSLLARRRKNDRSHPPISVDPASPEVITSLISSLSSISIPLQSHFDLNVPRIDSETDPSLPVYFPLENLSVSDQRPLSEHGLGVSYGAQNLADEPPHSPFLHPDDAAASPIIRMARAPPSPKSPKFKLNPERPASSGRPSSRSSFTSYKAAYEASAFGTITTEPGPQRVSTAASIHSTSSRKSLKSLLRKPSRELASEKDKQVERLRKTSSYTDGLRYNVPRSRASLRSLHSMADVVEEGRPTQFAMDSTREYAIGSPTGMERPSLQSNRESAPSTPGGIGSGRIIPARESSLRHGYSSSPKHRKSGRHSRYSSTASRASREAKADSGISVVGNETEQVTKRIQELKDQQQRIKSELETDNTPQEPTREPSTLPQSPQDVSDAGGSIVQNELIIDESAPSPAILTGRSRSFPRNSPQVMSRPPIVSSQSFVARQSFERPDPMEKLRYRRSVESQNAPRLHKRSPSNPISLNRSSVVGEDRPSSADSIDHAVFEYVASPKLTQRVLHPTSGRVIAFSEVGDPKGHVVLCCLGMGLTRYLMAFYDELARSLSLRLVTLDRPGVGESGPYVDDAGTPLSWPDDVAIVCNHLKVTKFSILAHSAGAIYALATALRIPQHIRGRIHLLAPWIPPSQLSNIGSYKTPVPNNAVPYSHRILRVLPTSFLKIANSSFMSATSASLTSSLPKSPRRSKRRATMKDGPRPISLDVNQQPEKADFKSVDSVNLAREINGANDGKTQIVTSQTGVDLQERERQIDYDNRLTHKIWELATTHANPAVDLLVCLERQQPIGFRYVDITRNVVIHHGSRDTRVPVDNVRWLGQTMRRCEVRILEGEGHGLMASAKVMGNVLMEIAKEWEDWMTVVQGKRRATLRTRSGSMVAV